MYYFDNKTLAQYLDQNIELEIFVEDEWYKIADLSDVSSPKLGVAYDLYSSPHRFDYREIEQIKAGTNIVTLDALQTQKGSKPAEEPTKGRTQTREKRTRFVLVQPCLRRWAKVNVGKQQTQKG